MFSTMCMTACHLSISWARCHPIMFPTSHVNIMLPPIPGLWSGLLPSGFPTKTMLYPFLFSPMHATCHTPHPPSFEHVHFLLYITSITHTHMNASWQHPFQTKLETALQWGLLPASTQAVWAQIQCVAGQAAIYSTFIFRVSLNCLTLNIRAQNSFKTSENIHSMPKHHITKDGSTAVRCSNLAGEVNFVL